MAVTKRKGVVKATVQNTKPEEDRIDGGRARSGFELPRKILHSSISIVVAFTWNSHPRIPTLLSGLITALAVVSAADVLRFSSKPFAKTYEKYLGLLMREEERGQINGVCYYLVGVITSVAIYPRDIAVLSVLMLSLCDTSASIFGRLFGHITPPLPFSGTLFGARKSLAGTFFASIVGCGASYIFFTELATAGDEGGDLSWVAARSIGGALYKTQEFWWPRLGNLNSTLSLTSLVVLNGVLAGLAEAIDVFGLDDNLTLPIIFGGLLWLSLKILG